MTHELRRNVAGSGFLPSTYYFAPFLLNQNQQRNIAQYPAVSWFKVLLDEQKEPHNRRFGSFTNNEK